MLPKNANEVPGLICIDLWEKDFHGNKFSDQYHAWLDRLVTHLAVIPFQSVINSSYYTQLDYSDPSIYNTMRRHNWQKHNSAIMLDLIKHSGNFRMSRQIIDTVFGEHTFFYTRTQDFLAHQRELVPHVTDWLVVGNTWQYCTHRFLMGLTGFAALSREPQHKHLRFYGTTWGFYKEDDTDFTAQDFSIDRKVKWSQVSDDLFRLSPKIVL